MNNMPPTGGAMITPGKWTNKNTGKQVFVRDSVIDGDHMIILTDNGQISMSEFSKNYIQADDIEQIPSLDDLYGHAPNSKTNSSLLAQINQGLDKEDKITINKVPNKPIIEKKIIDNTIIDNKSQKKQKENKNYELIKKVFDKYPIDRTINFEIVEDEWPFKEFNMLVNILDVPVKDICDYIIDNYLDKESLSNKLSEYFKKHIS